MAVEDKRKEPESNPTVEMPKVPQWAIEMSTAMKEGFKLTNANIEVVSNDLGIVKERLVIVENWKGEQDLRASKMSGGVRALSQTDLAHEAQLAHEKLAREALAAKVETMAAETSKQTAMLTSITGLLDKPLVRRLGYAVAGLMLAGLTSATGYLARGNVAAPQPTIIQVAPVAILDGGTQ